MEIKNQGEDAFKPEIYGDVITIERRISETTTSTVLKDHQGLSRLRYDFFSVQVPWQIGNTFSFLKLCLF